jgi:O-antigen/teichoic acid export membrane protein
VTVSGIVSPILTSLDRFLIGFVQGAQAVTYYAIPYNFANKFGIIPFSLQRALFPRFSVQHPSEARAVAAHGVIALAGAYTPVIVIAILLTRPFFQLWIGTVAAARCTSAGEIMLLGIWFNGIFALVPYALIQAQGRPDLTAKFHLLELAPFVAMLWVGIHFWGVPGAAVVLGIRFIADGLLLLGAAGIVRVVMRRLFPYFALLGVAFAGSLLVGERLIPRAALVVLLGGASVYTCLLVSPEVAQPVLLRLRALYSRATVDIPMGVER